MIDCQAETPTPSTTGSVQASSLHKHVQTAQWQITRWPIPCNTYSTAECAPSGNMLSINVEHAKTRQPFKLRSQHMHCRQKSQTANDSGLCVMTKQAEVAHYSTPVCQVYNARHKGLGERWGLHEPREEQTCTSHTREVEVSVAILLERVGFADQAHGQRPQNLEERARTAWRCDNCSRSAVGKPGQTRFLQTFSEHFCVWSSLMETSITDGPSTILVTITNPARNTWMTSCTVCASFRSKQHRCGYTLPNALKRIATLQIKPKHTTAY